MTSDLGLTFVKHILFDKLETRVKVISLEGHHVDCGTPVIGLVALEIEQVLHKKKYNSKYQQFRSFIHTMSWGNTTGISNFTVIIFFSFKLSGNISRFRPGYLTRDHS